MSAGSGEAAARARRTVLIVEIVKTAAEASRADARCAERLDTGRRPGGP